jgi:hypothetical protein
VIGTGGSENSGENGDIVDDSGGVAEREREAGVSGTESMDRWTGSDRCRLHGRSG